MCTAWLVTMQLLYRVFCFHSAFHNFLQ